MKKLTLRKDRTPVLNRTSNVNGDTIDFGYQTVQRAEKTKLVGNVFNSVAKSYDLMNDLMSGGIHRLWRMAMIDWMAPQPNHKLIDVAGGTGDISIRFLRAGGGSAYITDINHSMINNGRKRSKIGQLKKRLHWSIANAECMPFSDCSSDFVTIAFGLRNVTDRQAAIDEAYRVLKPGGRFLCLEFSHVQNDLLKSVYDKWSFNVLPLMGKMILNDSFSYRYLAESIRAFPSKEMLADMFSRSGFVQIRIRTLSGGIACIHSGWKLD